MDETNDDSLFVLYRFRHPLISAFQRRRVRARKVCNKNLYAIKLFQFCDLKAQKRFIFQEELHISKRERYSVVNSLKDFHKLFDTMGNCLQIPLQKPKIENRSTKLKYNFLARYYKKIIEHPNGQKCFAFKTTNPASFPSRNLNYKNSNL